MCESISLSVLETKGVYDVSTMCHTMENSNNEKGCTQVSRSEGLEGRKKRTENSRELN